MTLTLVILVSRNCKLRDRKNFKKTIHFLKCLKILNVGSTNTECNGKLFCHLVSKETDLTWSLSPQTLSTLPIPQLIRCHKQNLIKIRHPLLIDAPLRIIWMVSKNQRYTWVFIRPHFV